MPQRQKMRFSGFALAAALTLAFLVLPACGGGGNGFNGPQADLTVVSAVLPQFLSGNFVDHEIPISGGCGGEYVVQIVDGVVPDDLAFENRKVPNGDGTFRNAFFVTGYLIEAGTFNWRLQITDTACTPFQSITQDFAWTVGEGPLVIVNANPSLVPQDQLDVGHWEAAPGEAKIDGFKKTTYNQFVAINLVVAGGRGPYSCEVVDDPADANDALLPQGVSMPPGSCSIVGSPVQVLAGGVPFLLTIEATDSLGQKTRRKLQWKVDTPPIIVATTSLPNGTAGVLYNELFQFADGVPPFQVEFMDAAGEPDFEQHVYDSPNLPTFPTTPTVTVNGSGASTNRLAGAYPAKDAPGPVYTPYPSEGMFLVDQGSSTGSFTGTPRRVGTFDINLHVYSLLVPNERGQHGFQSYNFSIAGATAPVGMNTLTWTSEVLPTPNLSAPFSTMPEISQGAVYNPDGGLVGVELIATGGVPFDGYNDAPHDSDRSSNGEAVGDYRWDVDFDPDSNGAYNPLDPVIEMLSVKVDGYGDNYFQGRWGVSLANTANTQKGAFKELTFTVKDEQLPNDPGQPWHEQNERTDRFRYSVGPDRVIVTESSVSATVTQTTGYGYTGMDYEFMKIRAFQVVAGIGSVSNLSSADLIGTIPSPATTAGIANDELGKLLSGVSGGDADLDLVRIVMNAGGYWNDNGSINNENGAGGQKGDNSGGQPYTNEAYNYGQTTPDNTSTFMVPYADGVTHDPANGVYANGGQMYAFDSDNYFGFFIIRPDSKIYVPWATRKGTFNSFGDTMWQTRKNFRRSIIRSCMISVSPDGRTAACEITSQQPTTSNTATLAHVSVLPSSIVVFSLTGEKRWNGNADTWNVIDGNTAGVTQTSSGYSSSTSSGYRAGKFLWAQSLTLTNDNLYYIIGNWAGRGSNWCDHYIMKAGIFDSIGSATHTPVGGNWTQTASVPMQTPFNGVWHREMTGSNTNWNGTNGTFTGVRLYQSYVMNYDNMNYTAQMTAPHPFRVNRTGTHCALLAGPRVANFTSSANAMRHYVWVDTGSGFVQVSSDTQRWSPTGGSRGASMMRGYSSMWYYAWGWYSGPTTAFEISDDGSKVAWVAYTNIGTTSTSSSGRYGSAQQEIFAATTTNNWTSATEVSITTAKFLGSMYWRFGSLVFTNDNDGLLFWGGYSGVNVNSSSRPSYEFVGTYYSWEFSTATLKSCFDSNDGGGADDIKTYSTTSVAPSGGTRSGAGGNILPFLGFRSKSGDFYYIVTEPATGSGNSPTGTDRSTGCQLLGLNVSTLGSGNINGHPNGEGFSMDYWPSARGFIPKYYYAPYYSLNINYYAPAHSGGFSKHAMAKDNGYVFFAAHYQRSTANADNSFGGASTAARWQDYGGYGGKVYGFDSDIGGRINEISDASFTSDTQARLIHYLDVSSDGSRVAYTFSMYSTYPRHDYERIGVTRKIAFTGANGAPAPGMQRVLMEASNGRSGESMAFDSTGTRMYYAYKSSTGGNENAKVLVEGVQNAVGAFTKTPYGSTARWTVLHAGR